MRINLLVEGPTDEIVLKKILSLCGHEYGVVYGRQGYDYIRRKIRNFAQLPFDTAPIVTLVDFRDTGVECVAELREHLLGTMETGMLLRAAVREIESWLLADRQAIAAFLNVSVAHVPLDPEQLELPKRSFVNLARRCRNKKLRESIVPADGTSNPTGPGYVSEIQRFVNENWCLERASSVSPSLSRAVERFKEL